MKKHVVISGKKINSAMSFKVDYKSVVCFTVVVCGIIIGVNVSGSLSSEWQSFFESVIKNFLAPPQRAGYITVFLRLFLPFATMLIVTFIVGLSGVGIPFILLTPLISGCFFGVVISQCYENFGISGVGAFAFVHLPIFAISTATLIKSCSGCFDISSEIFWFTATGKGSGKPVLKEYIIKYSLFLLVIALSVALSALAYEIYLKLFPISL